jgi:hypothetical protein
VADQHEKDNGEVVRGQHGRAPLTSDDPLTESYSPDDLSGIQADDALLDALGGKDSGQALVQDDLNALLLAWRRDVDSQPIADLVDTDTAVATIAAARPMPRSKHRFLIPLASAAAVLAIAFTGVSLVARDAEPGDALWGLTRVLYSDHARSIEAAVAVRTDLETARAALREGKVNEAKDALDKAQAVLPNVSVDDGKVDLSQKHEQLVEELVSTNPTLPGAPVSSTDKPTKPSPTQPQATTTTPPSTTTPPPTTTPPVTTTTPSTLSSEQNPPPPPPPPPPPTDTTAGTATAGTANANSTPTP